MSTAKRKGASRLGRGLDALLSPAISGTETKVNITEVSNTVKVSENEL